MSSKCDHCGEFAVDDSETETVCHACGIVVDDIKFPSPPEFFQSTKSTYTPSRNYQARLSGKKKDPITLTHGLNVLDSLCHTNNVSCHWKPEIAALLKLVASVRNFTNREDVGVTAACCLFLFQRRNKQAIPINTLCQQVQCTKKKFSYYLKILKSCLKTDKFKQYSSLLENGQDEIQMTVETVCVPDVIESFIHDMCDKARQEEKSQLMKNTSQLVELATSCWLLTGRSPRSVVAASAYLCWKSMSPLRQKSSFSKFCREFEINEPTARLRIPELKDLLLNLGRKIPSYAKDYVNEKNYLFHLNTILEHSETFRNDLFPDKHTQEEVDSAEFSTFRTPPVRFPRQEPTSGLRYDPDINASDVEISDSEIESYIIPDRKKNAIQMCKKIKSEMEGASLSKKAKPSQSKTESERPKKK